MSDITLYNTAMFLTGSALALTSAGTTYYIWKHHPDHFKKTIFNTTVETYTTVKTKTTSLVNGIYSIMSRQDVDGVPQVRFDLTDVKIIQIEGLIIDFPVSALEDISWSNYKPGTMIHICYTYGDQNYRAVFGFGQDLSILTTNTGWIDEGFHNGIDMIDTNLDEENKENLWELMHQYGGPLGDFYGEAKHIQPSRGFLNKDMTQVLLEKTGNKYIKITNILGESRRFPPQPKDHPLDSPGSNNNLIEEHIENNVENNVENTVEDSVENNLGKPDGFF